MEMKVIAAHLLRNYQWELLPNQNLEDTRFSTSRPQDGPCVKFQTLN